MTGLHRARLGRATGVVPAGTVRETPASSPFHGVTVRSVTSKLMQVRESVYPAHLQVPRHSHGGAYLGINVQGTAEQECGREVRTSGPGSLTLHPAGECHSDRFGASGARAMSIEFLPPMLQLLRETGGLPPAAIHATGGEAVGLGRRLYGEFRMDDDLSPLALEGLVLEIVAHLLRQQGRADRCPPWLHQVEDCIRARMTESLRLSDLAAVAGVHPVHLARSFRRFEGCTVASFIRRLRVERACRELQREDASPVEIALACGFRDQSQFCRTFKRVTGLRPSQFRAQLRS